VLVLIILNGIALGTVAGVWYFFGYTQALVVAGAGIAVILGFLNR
jgi:hypothetical protein